MSAIIFFLVASGTALYITLMWAWARLQEDPDRRSSRISNLVIKYLFLAAYTGVMMWRNRDWFWGAALLVAFVAGDIWSAVKRGQGQEILDAGTRSK